MTTTRTLKVTTLNLSRHRTVVSRIINSTPLPSLLRTDSSANHRDGVSSGIVAMTYFSLATTVILAVAQVLAPIGLSETLVPVGLANVTFDYVRDRSSFGAATYRREDYILARTCMNKSCPGVPDEWLTHFPEEFQFSTLLPKNITEVFTSGTLRPNDLRVSPFDIEFRQFVAQQTGNSKEFSEFNVAGIFEYIGQVTSESGYPIREGIVVDAITGGVAFRNHTVPSGCPTSGRCTWSEDLLWVIPVTSCVRTGWEFGSQMHLSPGSWQAQMDTTGHFLTYKHDSRVFDELPIDPHRPFHLGQRLQDASKELTKQIVSTFNLTGSSAAWTIPYDYRVWLPTDLSQLTSFALGVYSFQIYNPGNSWSDGVGYIGIPKTTKPENLLSRAADQYPQVCISSCQEQLDACLDDCFTTFTTVPLTYQLRDAGKNDSHVSIWFLNSVVRDGTSEVIRTATG